MRRFSLAFMTISFSVFISSLLVLGCGGKNKDDDEDDAPRNPKKKREAGPSTPATLLKPVEAKEGYTTLSGKILAQGDLTSAIAEANTAMKSAIAGTKDATFCTTGKTESETSPVPILPFETNQQDYRVGANKGLGNVFVWIEPEDGFTFDIPADQLAAVSKEVTITQPHCAFLPHCTIVFPSYYKAGAQVKTGQKLIIENDALVTHNAKIAGLTNNSNSLLTPRSKDGSELRPDKSAVSISCDVHKWMKGYIRVFTHPYAAISSVGADMKDPKKKVWENADSPTFGTYTITGVPVGAKVKVFAWHEKLGFLTAASGDPIVITKDMKKDFTK